MNEAQTRLDLIDSAIRVANMRKLDLASLTITKKDDILTL